MIPKTLPLKPWHMIRYGISPEQKYFSKEFIGTYDVLVFNGNMIAHIPTAIAKFIGDRLGIKEFIIDPLTHAFQHNPEKLSTKDTDGKLVLKSSIVKMAKAFGAPIEDKVNKHETILPKDFKDTELRKDFCGRVLRFQKDTIQEQADKQDFMKYYKFMGINSIEPILLIAPYFYMTENTIDKWIDLNIKFINLSKEIFPDKLIFAQLVISSEILSNENKLTKIIKKYGNTDCDGILVWINEFPEHEVGFYLLKGFIQLVKSLNKDYTKEVYNLYGGYFSVLLTSIPQQFKLSGVCHGLEYAEDRGVIPVGGGLPVSKFYYPPLHKRIRHNEVVRILRHEGYLDNPETYYKNVCNCRVCRETLKEDISKNFGKYGEARPITFRRKNQIVTLNYPLPKTRDLCLRHYLHNKEKEFKEVQDLTKEGVITNLKKNLNTCERLFGLEESAVYCKDWIRVLRNKELV